MRKTLAGLLLLGLLTACARPESSPLPPPQLPEPIPAPPQVTALRTLHDLPQTAVPSLPRWSPDGRTILYAGPAGPDNPHGAPTVLQVGGAESPRLLTMLPSFTAPVWHPDGNAVVFAGGRQEAGETATTLWLQPTAGGNPTDLLPGALARMSVSGTKWPVRWLDNETLAYLEHTGSGVEELRLLDTTARKLVSLPEGEMLAATFFRFAPDGSRVAGQWDGGPPSFWIWDVSARRRLSPPEALPGRYQWFEAWDGAGSVLFTAWNGAYPYSEEKGSVTLYRWDLETGTVVRLVDGALLAEAAAGRISYLRLTPSPAVVVADTSGRELWHAELGALPSGRALWEFEPRLNQRFVLYQTAAFQWRIAPAAEGAAGMIVHEGGARATAGFSPDGRYLTVLVHDVAPRLLIMKAP